MWLRGSGARLEVLIGRRSQATRFMPGYYVFPGGRVDPADYQASGFAESLPRQPLGLDWRSSHKLMPLARTALRETFEETGLLAGSAGRPRRKPPPADIWLAYQNAGRAPAFDRLRLFARAVTPSFSPIRFNTRFFLAQDCAADGRLEGNGELEELAWRPVAEVARLPLATVTALVLSEALRHARARRRRAALLFWIRPKIGRRYSLRAAPRGASEPA